MRHCLNCRYEPEWRADADEMECGVCRYPLPIPVQRMCVTREGDQVFVWEMVRMRAHVRVIEDCPVWEAKE